MTADIKGQPTQNKAHHEDMIWAKAGRSAYLRSDGVMIVKDAGRAWWRVILPSGKQAAWSFENPATGEIETLECTGAGAQSLTRAKYLAEFIAADTPEVVR